MLGRQVRTDIDELDRSIQGLIIGGVNRPGNEPVDLSQLVQSEEILVDWDDDWLVADRERFRILRLEALERAADFLLGQGQLSRALEVAVVVMVAEPLRESTRRVIAEIQISQGNIANVIRGYEEYRTLLRQELGLEPTPALDAIVTRVAGEFIQSRAHEERARPHRGKQ